MQCTYYLGTIPILRQQKDWVGGLSKVAIFADIQYCIYADLVCGWVRKGLKLYWRNIWMVFYIKLVSRQCLESQVSVCLNTQWVEINSQGVFLFMCTLLFVIMLTLKLFHHIVCHHVFTPQASLIQKEKKVRCLDFIFQNLRLKGFLALILHFKLSRWSIFASLTIIY